MLQCPLGTARAGNWAVCAPRGTRGKTKAAVSHPPTRSVLTGFLCCPPQRQGRNVQPGRIPLLSVPIGHPSGWPVPEESVNEVAGRARSAQPPDPSQDAVGDSASFPNCKLPGNIREALGKGWICHSPCDLSQVPLTESESCVLLL